MNRLDDIRERFTLLERAKASPAATRRRLRYDDEAIQLAVAYINAQIIAKQAAEVLGIDYYNVRTWVASTLTRAVDEGKVKVEVVP